jgi:hypothetical protein
VTLPTTCCTGLPEPPDDELLAPLPPGKNLPGVVMSKGLADRGVWFVDSSGTGELFGTLFVTGPAVVVIWLILLDRRGGLRRGSSQRAMRPKRP